MGIPYKYSLPLFTLLLCVAGCKKPTNVSFLPSNLYNANQRQKAPSKTHHHLMVFIHGTLFPVPSIECLGSSLRTFFEKGRTLKKSWYQLYIDELKRKAIFRHQPNGPDGLCPIDHRSSLPAQIAYAFFINFYKKHFPNVYLSCYTFGWNGRLDHRKRVNAAHDLYKQLINEIRQLNTKNVSITLIGHSHGGNVILNLAHAEETYQQHLTIDKAILLGTPIQSETQSLIEHSLFKAVYNCYSNGDRVQRIDFLSTKDNHSQRRFSVDANTPYADKLTQIELTFGQYRPGHGELWLAWGRDNILYRKNLPIFPLPSFIFLPEIIYYIEQIYPKLHDIIVDVDQSDVNYAITIYNSTAQSQQEHQKISSVLLPKKYFKPYIQTIFQNENYLPKTTNQIGIA